MDNVKIFLSFLSKMEDDVSLQDEDGNTLLSLGEMKIKSVLVQAVVVSVNETYIIVDDGTHALNIQKDIDFKYKVGQYLQFQLTFSPDSDGSLYPEISKTLDLSHNKPNRESLWTYEVMHIHVTYYLKFIDRTGKSLSKLKSEMNSNKSNSSSNISPNPTLSTSPTVHLKEEEKEEEEGEPQQHETINLDDTDDQDLNTIIEEESIYSRKNEQDFDYDGYYEGDTSNMDDLIFNNVDDGYDIDYKDNRNYNIDNEVLGGNDNGNLNNNNNNNSFKDEDDEMYSEFSAPPQLSNKKLKLSKSNEDNKLNNSNNNSNFNNNINENSMDDSFSFSNNDTSNIDQENTLGSDDSWGE